MSKKIEFILLGLVLLSIISLFLNWYQNLFGHLLDISASIYLTLKIKVNIRVQSAISDSQINGNTLIGGGKLISVVQSQK